jgi:hypothetical protein
VVGTTPTYGCLSAAVACNFDFDGQNVCYPVATNPSWPYTIVSRKFAVQSAVAVSSGVLAAPTAPTDVTLLGFGVVGQGHNTRVKARAFGARSGVHLIQPQLRVAVGEPLGGPPLRFYSGPVERGRHFRLHHDFASSVERCLDHHEVQGVLEIKWPSNSRGARCLLEVRQEVAEGPSAGKRIGAFVIGLEDNPEDPVWF